MTALRCCCSAAAAAASYSTTASSASQILDVLLPPPGPAAARSFRRHMSSSSRASVGIGAVRSDHDRKKSDAPRLGAPRPSLASTNATRTRPTAAHGAVITAARPLLSPRHGAFFGTTAPRRKTRTIHNPQRDEEGNEMVLEITPRAADRLSHLMKQDQNPDLALRIQVEPGGCHGFQYMMSVTTLPALTPSSSPSTTAAAPPPPDADAVAAEVAPSTTTSDEPAETAGLRDDDTVFAFVPEGSGAGEAGGQGQGQERAAAKIVLDGPSLELLKGSKVDYTMELIGSQFKIVDNPHATSSCGCGTSFDIKDLGL